MTATSVSYLLFLLFRPVIYRFNTLAKERVMAQELTKLWGRSAMDYFKLWPDKSYFFSSYKQCFIAYRVVNGFAIVLGDPVGDPKHMRETIKAFIGFCRENDWEVVFHQTLPDFLPIYSSLGLRKLKIGDDAVVNLADFNLEGRQAKKFRNQIHRLERQGIQAIYYPAPISIAVLKQMEAVSDEWLRLPGRRERKFSLGQFDCHYLRSTPVLAAMDSNGKMIAFVNIIPSYRAGESTVDLMRHCKDAPKTIMDYLFIKLMLKHKEAGFKYFNFGLVPMVGFQKDERPSLEEKAIHFFFSYLNFLFRYMGLKQYKEKFCDFWEPRYLIYRRTRDLPQVALALNKVLEF